MKKLKPNHSYFDAAFPDTGMLKKCKNPTDFQLKSKLSSLLPH